LYKKDIIKNIINKLFLFNLNRFTKNLFKNMMLSEPRDIKDNLLKLENVNKNVKSIEDFHIKIGKYGPYILYNSKFYKIKNEYIRENLTEEDCIKIVGPSNINNKNVKSIGDYHIKIGKYGPYILYNGKFYKIKNEYVPENLTEEDCLKIVGVNNIKNDNDSNNNNKSKPIKKNIGKKTTKK
jgi:hypothetical protein